MMSLEERARAGQLTRINRDDALRILRHMEHRQHSGAYDPDDHMRADEVLLRLIHDPEITSAFLALRRFYS